MHIFGVYHLTHGVELLDFPDKDEWIHYCMGPAHFVMVAKMQNGYTRLLMSQPADKADGVEVSGHG